MSSLCYNRAPEIKNDEGASLVRIGRQIATVFGLGHQTKAPGTLGTLAAVPIWYGLVHFGDLTYLAATLAVVVLGIWVSHVYVTAGAVEDPSEIVIDEVAGFLITMALLPPHWFYLLAGFLLFRVLDIFKPFPISRVDQRMKGGLGVMADDMLAGMFANLILQMLHQSGWLPW